VAGLFTALGVTSIVLGLALQNAVGSVISGLLLLFEQPFGLGDWLQTPTARGRVVEVNWRAVHIDTGNGIQIMPNAALASASFTNLSRPSGAHSVSISSVFGLQDRPDQVCALLQRLAAALPQVLPGTVPTVTVDGPKSYKTTVKVASPAVAGAVTAMLQRWAWYAARREGLHLDEATDDFADPELTAAAVRTVAPTLHLGAADIDDLIRDARLERFGAGEPVQLTGSVPDCMRLILTGRAQLTVGPPGGGQLIVGLLAGGDYLGQTALTREKVTAAVSAVDELTVLRVPVAAVDALVHSKPELARDIGRAIDLRRQRVVEAVRAGGGAQLAALPGSMGRTARGAFRGAR
jgi:CRP-like cAMP-binding protein